MISISFVIPTYNRLARLKQVLAGLEAQTVPCSAFEVVVVSDGSKDGTDEYLRDLETPLRLRPVFQPNSGVAAARNNGFRHANGELIVFLDDDVVPTPHLLAEHLRSHGDCIDRSIVLGPMLTPNDFIMKPWVAWEQDMLMKQYRAMEDGEWEPTARQFYTGNTSLARRHLLDSGGFDERFRRAEDVELAYRLAKQGLNFIFNSAAIGYHYADRSFRSWIEIPYVYGRNDVIFTRDKAQEWLLPKVCDEFHGRNLLVRTLVWLCLSRQPLTQSALLGLRMAADTGERLGNKMLVRFAHSGMFNLRYYQGIADELGGRKQFLARL
jgi:GT2 family glycosyltransferase